MQKMKGTKMYVKRNSSLGRVRGWVLNCLLGCLGLLPALKVTADTYYVTIHNSGTGDALVALKIFSGADCVTEYGYSVSQTIGPGASANFGIDPWAGTGYSWKVIFGGACGGSVSSCRGYVSPLAGTGNNYVQVSGCSVTAEEEALTNGYAFYHVQYTNTSGGYEMFDYKLFDSNGVEHLISGEFEVNVFPLPNEGVVDIMLTQDVGGLLVWGDARIGSTNRYSGEGWGTWVPDNTPPQNGMGEGGGNTAPLPRPEDYKSGTNVVVTIGAGTVAVVEGLDRVEIAIRGLGAGMGGGTNTDGYVGSGRGEGTNDMSGTNEMAGIRNHDWSGWGPLSGLEAAGTAQAGLINGIGTAPGATFGDISLGIFGTMHAASFLDGSAIADPSAAHTAVGETHGTLSGKPAVLSAIRVFLMWGLLMGLLIVFTTMIGDAIMKILHTPSMPVGSTIVAGTSLPMVNVPVRVLAVAAVFAMVLFVPSLAWALFQTAASYFGGGFTVQQAVSAVGSGGVKPMIDTDAVLGVVYGMLNVWLPIRELLIFGVNTFVAGIVMDGAAMAGAGIMKGSGA